MRKYGWPGCPGLDPGQGLAGQEMPGAYLSTRSSAPLSLPLPPASLIDLEPARVGPVWIRLGGSTRWICAFWIIICTRGTTGSDQTWTMTHSADLPCSTRNCPMRLSTSNSGRRCPGKCQTALGTWARGPTGHSAARIMSCEPANQEPAPGHHHDRHRFCLCLAMSRDSVVTPTPPPAPSSRVGGGGSEVTLDKQRRRAMARRCSVLCI